MSRVESKISLKLANLPDNPGVYLFYGANNALLYVGKATSLKQRVKSYWQKQRNPRPIEEMIYQVEDIAWVETESVLEAIILEADYIKKFNPKYNVLGKDDKSWNYLYLTKDRFPKLQSLRQHELSKIDKGKIKAIFGPYPGLNTKEAMTVLRKMFFWSDCEPNSDKPCFYYQLDQCLGVCTGEISAEEYESRVIKPLTLFLLGQKKQVMRDFEKKMKQASEKENFEQATLLRNQLYQLKKIQDITLINRSFFEDELFLEKDAGKKLKEKYSRIEGYDISNLGSSDKVGSLVLFQNGIPKKSGYKKFNIKGVVGQSDVDCLKEIISRRFTHSEWGRPDLLLIDGGRGQVNAVKTILEEKNISLPVVGIAKGPARKKNEFILGEKNPEFVAWVFGHQELLIRVRDEAHRFAIKFNRSKRKI
ncbi:MAG TPA: GIY-YIG nuclease family protein [Candidatus Magasanikbacteria bacterium]|nr:GIY-YIG nuclease family protein [Candidatus Magasanikbacteria bacterium]